MSGRTNFDLAHWAGDTAGEMTNALLTFGSFAGRVDIWRAWSLTSFFSEEGGLPPSRVRCIHVRGLRRPRDRWEGYYFFCARDVSLVCSLDSIIGPALVRVFSFPALRGLFGALSAVLSSGLSASPSLHYARRSSGAAFRNLWGRRCLSDARLGCVSLLVSFRRASRELRVLSFFFPLSILWRDGARCSLPFCPL